MPFKKSVAVKFFLVLGVFAHEATFSPGVTAQEGEKAVRSPRQVAEQLAAVYGQKLDQVAYIPALPLVAKLRLSELTGDPKYADEVHKIVAPFLRGDKTPVPKSGSEQAGHLIFAELAQRAKGKDRERWMLLCRTAADQIFGKDGKPLAAHALPQRDERRRLHGRADPGGDGQADRRAEVLRRRRHALRLDAETVPATRRHLSAFAPVRGRLGARQRLSRTRSRPRPQRLARRPSRRRRN